MSDPPSLSRVERLYHAALERSPGERDAFLRQASGDDASLLREVRSLLALEGHARGFIEEPAAAAATQEVRPNPAGDRVGRRLGIYEVLAPLGAGGMGEVYRAKDTRLGREVALKLLPEAFSHDPERIARFQREARLLAALNHPNIASIHGLEEAEGRHLLVMELVPGGTLADRVSGGSLPVAEALSVFCEVAEALEAAHDKGILHRDLKPANVAITPDGRAKLLDFGLAKALSGEATPADADESPTISEEGTRDGLVLGTISYMSPEQARGRALDERTDIWSFGCCFFEALAGSRAFRGETTSDTIAAVLEKEVDWTALPASTPASTRRLLRRCLQKERKRRLRHIADARLEIEEALASPPDGARRPVEAETAASPGRRRWPYLWIVLSGGLGLTLGMALLRLAPADPRGAAVVRTTIQLAREPQAEADNFRLALSSDGKTIAYADTLLHVRRLDELMPRPIQKSAPAASPFFSPDGRWLGFVTRTSGRKVPLSGGAPVVLWPRGRGGQGGACWLESGTIVFGARATWGGLVQLRGGEGALEELTQPDLARGHYVHRWPRPLPGGRAVLLTIGRAEMDSWDDASIAVLEADAGEPRVVLDGGSQAAYSSTGHLVYVRGGALLAVPFDLAQRRVVGTPVAVVEGVNADAGFSLSENGSLLYAPAAKPASDSRMLLVGRDGRDGRVLAKGGSYHQPRFSPDGRRVVFVTGGATPDIRVLDISRGTDTAITSRWVNAYTRWTPDGRHVLFDSVRSGWWNTHRRLADGSGPIEHLLETPDHISSLVGDASGIALWLETPGPDIGSGFDMMLRSAETGAPLRPFLATDSFEGMAELSPDGEWVVYQSDESGRFEVYLRPFPEGSGQWLVSNGGGTRPRWSRGGREIVYLDGDRVMAVDLSLDRAAPGLGQPKELFRRTLDSMFGVPAFDVTPDGESFVIVEPGPRTARPDHLVLVQNFDDELARLMAEAEGS